MSTAGAQAADLKAAAVREAVAILRNAVEMQTSLVVRKVLERIRAEFVGAPPPAPSRRQLTEAAIYGAIGRMFVETVRQTSDGRKGTGRNHGYRAFLSLASTEALA